MTLYLKSGTKSTLVSALGAAGLTFVGEDDQEHVVATASPNGIRVDVKWHGQIKQLAGYDEEFEPIWTEHTGWHADVKTDDQVVIDALAYVTLDPPPATPYHKFAGD
ncbi:MAG: hypothetical protein CMN85_10820 [Spongiibacteraceae bacterium]|uniref:hypothetical protein n=1 Tax=uncultured Haliea sp. TaxID=622616 RepID=UPI000C54EEE5|nr:hypothetical protein [Spongiibacteraceae bacterium]|tara:strand:+ start:8150 stop:8470 length:321 start_codon:yes stop_codon:yes gene_type:complete